MFPKVCATVVKRRKVDGATCVCGVPAPRPEQENSESKQEHVVEGFELELGMSGQSLWVPAGHVLCIPTEHGLPVQVTPEAFASEYEDP